MKKIKTTNKEIRPCPYCGSMNHEWVGDAFDEDNPRPNHCHECDSFFGEEDYEFEDLRHNISAMISADYGSEESPLVCKEPIIIGEYEAQGLSDAEKTKVVSMFHDQEGIVWFNLEDTKEPIEFDHIALSDARAIWNELSKY